MVRERVSRSVRDRTGVEEEGRYDGVERGKVSRERKGGGK